MAKGNKKQDAALLVRLNRIDKLLESVTPEVLGNRAKRIRDDQGISIRELAEKAAISKTSIVRLEQGRGTLPITILKVCSVLGVHIDRLVAPRMDDMTMAVTHQKGDDRWFDVADMGSAPLLGVAERALTASERKRAVAKGAQSPVNLLSSRLPGGKVLPSILEVYQQSPVRSHVGEEFAYVLSGTAVITVGEKKTPTQRRRVHRVLECRTSLLRAGRSKENSRSYPVNSDRRLS